MKTPSTQLEAKRSETGGVYQPKKRVEEQTTGRKTAGGKSGSAASAARRRRVAASMNEVAGRLFFSRLLGRCSLSRGTGLRTFQPIGIGRWPRARGRASLPDTEDRAVGQDLTEGHESSARRPSVSFKGRLYLRHTQAVASGQLLRATRIEE